MKRLFVIIIASAVFLAFSGCAFENIDKDIIRTVPPVEESTVESTPEEASETAEQPTETSTEAEKTTEEKTSEKKTTEEKTTAEKTTAEKTTEKKTTEEKTTAESTTKVTKSSEPETSTEKESSSEKKELPDLSGVWKGEYDSVIVLNKDFSGHFYSSRIYYRQGDPTIYNLTYEITDDNKVYIDHVFKFRIVSPVGTKTLHFVPATSTNEWRGEVFVRHPDLTEADIIQERIDSQTQAPSSSTAAPPEERKQRVHPDQCRQNDNSLCAGSGQARPSGFR